MTPAELRAIRGDRTQEQMAALIEVSLSGYRKWEQGQRRISKPVALLIRSQTVIAAATSANPPNGGE